jgi:phage gp36-like protein
MPKEKQLLIQEPSKAYIINRFIKNLALVKEVLKRVLLYIAYYKVIKNTAYIKQKI